ncbi:MAG: M20/M25/M40 family metallo-hydrolase, partial [Pseudobdellovibrionaceae bacterium]
NEGGAGMLYEDGNVEYIALSAAEKIYQDFKVTATGTAGHSSTPNNDNPINRLSEGLARLAKFKEPIQIIPVVESSLRARVPLEKDPALKKAMLAVANKPKNPPKDAIALLEKNPMLNAILKRTCVVTVVQAGAINMKNVLPSTAYANVNCRLLPGQEIADTKEKLVEIFADPKITVEEEPAFGHSEASSLDNPVVLAANEVSKKMFKNVPVVPSLLTGGTDSRFLRATGIPSYGIGPIFVTPSDRMFVHGANERMRPKILPVGIEFFHNLILVLAEKK